MSYLSNHASVEDPAFTGHVWLSGDGKVNGTVELDPTRTFLSFDNPAHARKLAAEVTRCAEAMEAFQADGRC